MTKYNRTGSAREYAKIHGVRQNLAAKWAREGRLKAVKTNSSWLIDLDQPPPHRMVSRQGEANDGEYIKCCTCKRDRPLAMYAPAGAKRGRCKECSIYMARKSKEPNHPEVISYRTEIEICLELEYAGHDIKRLREEKVRRHADRIAALGMDGDITRASLQGNAGGAV